MRRVVLAQLCGLSLVLLLAGCEALVRLLPQLGGNAPGEPGEPGEPEILRASKFLAIESGRVLSATTQGFRIIDVRDPRNPRVEGLYPLASNALDLYRMDEHVVLVATQVKGYGGERDDVPLRHATGSQSWLLNIDIRDRAHPTLINEIALDDMPRHSLLRSSPDGDALFVLPMIWNGERYQSRVDRYELRDGVLENTSQLTLDAVAEAIAATPEKLLVATQDDDATSSLVTALDITRPALSVAFTASLDGGVNPLTQLRLDGDQLRVLFEEPMTRTPSIATFRLSAAGVPTLSGRCKLGASSLWEHDASLFSAQAGEFFVSNARVQGDELEQIWFDASGNCPERRAYGPESRSYALRSPAPERLLAVGADALRLYDTASAEVLAQAPLAGLYVAMSAQPGIQLATLPTPSAAIDGTPEPILVSVPQYGPDSQGGVQLFTLSDRTLTPRATFDQRGYMEGTALFGRSLVAVSSTQLNTYDVSDSSRAVALGEVELAENYRHVFGFADHIVRIREHPWVLSPEDRLLKVKDDLQVLGRGPTPVASLPVEPVGQWLQVGTTVLVNAQLSVAQYGDEATRKARVTLQAYDLRDPSQPRKAGSLSTTEIEADWTGGHFPELSLSYHAVGDSLITVQSKRLPDLRVSLCRKTIDYDACANSDCTADVYTGSVICRTLDAEPEQCSALGQGISHCDADGCETLWTLPAGIPGVIVDCYDVVEPGRTTTFAFNVIDLRDPDQPTLIRPAFTLPDDNFVRHSFLVSDAKIYATEQNGDVLFGSEIDFSDPEAPRLSARHAVPGRIVAATEHDVYTVLDNGSALTLTRERCCGDEPPLTATRAWPMRSLTSLKPDGTGHLLLLYVPDAQSSWGGLEILDQETLATLGTLTIDRYADSRLSPSDGRLLVESYGALFLVDVRTPARPTMQAAVPYGSGPVVFGRGQLVVSDELGFRSYPTDLDNMVR